MLSLDHTAITVPMDKVDDVVNFLLAALKPLGLREHMRPYPGAVGLGDQSPYFWVMGIEGDAETLQKVMQCQHSAFGVTDNAQVDTFHKAALAAGGKCNGPPGMREMYHPGYYAAFVRDPACGINFEVVNHAGGSYAAPS